MNAQLVSKGLQMSSVLLSFSRHFRLIIFNRQQKVPSWEPVVQQLLIISPFGIFPLPPLSFSDIAHFRMDRMSQPLYWPSERPAERTYPEWAMGGRVVCGGERWQWRLGFIFCLLSQWAVPYIAESREAGSSPPSSMQQQGRAPALVTPGSRRWASCPFEPREQLHLKTWGAHSSIGSKTKSTEATS